MGLADRSHVICATVARHGTPASITRVSSGSSSSASAHWRAITPSSSIAPRMLRTLRFDCIRFPASQKPNPNLVLSWSANTLRVECPFCLSSHRHAVGGLPRDRQRHSADCYHISGGESYQILYPDEESDFTIPFGWELDKEESMIYTVTHQGRLCDPLSLRSQPRRLLDEHQDSSWPDENDKAATEDEDAIADSLGTLRLSNSKELDDQPPRVDDIWRDLVKDQSYRHKCYLSACCIKNKKELEALFHEYPEDSFANAVDEEGNNGILLAAAEDAGLDTVKWLEQNGVSTNQRNYYGRTALMEAALWGRLETVQFLIDRGASICLQA